MRYHCLAADYDGTLAHDGRVSDSTLKALGKLRDSGRKLVLVTGRELNELLGVFPQVELFDHVVAENGALLYNPAAREERILAEAPPSEFVDELRKRGVHPISQGRVIVATWQPHEFAVLELIMEMGLELQVIFNKHAVMVLPSGANKATGLHAALADLQLSPHNVVGVGDAENDHAFLSLCEYSAAVANALPAVKQHADMTTVGERGDGVRELIEELVENDLSQRRLERHNILLGTAINGSPVRVQPYGHMILLAGTSGSGKSTLATALLERLADREYQFCIVDPEGDYQDFANAVILGSASRAPVIDEVVRLLENPRETCVVNMVGVPIEHRSAFFAELLPAIDQLRARTGRPHWLVLDEAHHLLPESAGPQLTSFPLERHGMLLVTVHPSHIAASALQEIDLAIAIGKEPLSTLTSFCDKVGETPPAAEPMEELHHGDALAWWRRPRSEPFLLHGVPPRTERKRHLRKYATGEIEEERSFYYRGPARRLNLRAQNLILFMQIADGVDDDTWMYHLRRGDYSKWFGEVIKDPELAEKARAVEENRELDPQESREMIRLQIESRYAPAA